MLDDNNWLRRQPACLNPLQRLQASALVFAHDTMEISLTQLRQVALVCSPQLSTRAERVALFTAAWTIVDQVHVARQLLTLMTDESRLPETAEYILDTEVARELRNAMDHLNQNLPNRAKMKGALFPTFGSLWFFRPRPAEFETGVASGKVRGDAVCLTSGPTVGEMTATMPFEGVRLEIPLCGLTLQAFDRIFRLEDAVRRLEPILVRMSLDGEEQVTHKAKEIAATTGQSVDAMLAAASPEVQLSFDVGLSTQ